MRDLKPHFEIFIKVNWLLNGEILVFFSLLCKEIVKRSQKIIHKQVGFKINDKFAFSESASGGNILPVAALFNEIKEILQKRYSAQLNCSCIKLNSFFPFTFIKPEVFTAKAIV